MYFKSKVKVTVVTESGKEKSTRYNYIVVAESIEDATKKTKEEFKDFVEEWEVEKVEQTKLEGIIE